MINLLDKNTVLKFIRESAINTFKDLHNNRSLSNQQKTKLMNEKLETILQYLINIADDTYKMPEKTYAAFLVYYCWIIVSFESRNYLWKYESMDLSRRSGELWENLLKVCWKYSIHKDVKDFKAPDFNTVANQIKQAHLISLQNKRICKELISEVYGEYEKIWSILGDSINLDSDKLFETATDKYIIDFKGSYGSNEKGNKERLLTVARVYDLLNSYRLTDKPYRCILAVRTIDGEAHNYLRQLESSGLWTVVRGIDVYKMIYHFTGFDILGFIMENNLSLVEDFDENTRNYMNSKFTSKQKLSFAEYYLT